MALDNPDFLNLPAPVAALFAKAARRSFFALPIWYHVLARFGTDVGDRVRLYLDDASAPTAALACRVSATAPRELLSLSNYYSCEHGPILDGAGTALAPALARIAAEIASERPAWDAIRLGGLDPEDPGFALVAGAFGTAGWSVHKYFDSGTWYEDTGGLSFADYLKALPPALRNTWRRKAAKLERSGRLSEAFHDRPAGIADGIAAYEAVYRNSWKGHEPYPAFTSELIHAAAACGALRLGILNLDGEPAAAQLWLAWQGRATIYKLAHDQRFDDLSLGTLLTMRMFERVLDGDQPQEINFGRGDDGYKKLWLPKRRERWGLLIANRRTPRGLMLAARQTAGEVVRRWRGARPPAA